MHMHIPCFCARTSLQPALASNQPDNSIIKKRSHDWNDLEFINFAKDSRGGIDPGTSSNLFMMSAHINKKMGGVILLELTFRFSGSSNI